MTREEFHKLFKSPGPVVTPVIHVLDTAQILRNVGIAVGAGAAGGFLINHDFEKEKLVPIIRDVREAMPGLWFGVNFLAVPGSEAFPISPGFDPTAAGTVFTSVASPSRSNVRSILPTTNAPPARRSLTWMR